MNEDLTLIPEGVEVQLKVIAKRHNNEVWTLGKKVSGKLEIKGFEAGECTVKGFKTIEQ